MDGTHPLKIAATDWRTAKRFWTIFNNWARKLLCITYRVCITSNGNDKTSQETWGQLVVAKIQTEDFFNCLNVKSTHAIINKLHWWLWKAENEDKTAVNDIISMNLCSEITVPYYWQNILLYCLLEAKFVTYYTE